MFILLSDHFPGLCYWSAWSSLPGSSDHHSHGCGGSLLLLHRNLCGLPGGLAGSRHGVQQSEQVTAHAADCDGAGSHHSGYTLVFALCSDGGYPFRGISLCWRDRYRLVFRLLLEGSIQVGFQSSSSSSEISLCQKQDLFLLSLKLVIETKMLKHSTKRSREGKKKEKITELSVLLNTSTITVNVTVKYIHFYIFQTVTAVTI